MEPKPTTQAAGEQKSDTDKLKHLTAQGNVAFVSRQMHFLADRIDYDPNTHWMSARGNDRARAVLYDEHGLTSGTFDELTYNLSTGEHKLSGFSATIRK